MNYDKKATFRRTVRGLGIGFVPILINFNEVEIGAILVTILKMMPQTRMEERGLYHSSSILDSAERSAILAA